MKIEMTVVRGPERVETVWTAEVKGGPLALPARGEAAKTIGAGVPVRVFRDDVEVEGLEWRRSVLMFAGGATVVLEEEGIGGRDGNPSWQAATKSALSGLSMVLRLAADLARELHRLGADAILDRAVLRDDRLILTIGEVTTSSHVVLVTEDLAKLQAATKEEVLRAIVLRSRS